MRWVLIAAFFLVSCTPVLRVEDNTCVTAYERIYEQTQDRDAAADVYWLCISEGLKND